MVAQATAVSSGMSIFLTTVRIQSARLVAEPAMAPLETRVASFPTTFTSSPPKVYWPVPPFVKVEDYPGAQYIYSHIMSISCDERFNMDDMQKIVEAFENY